MHDLLIVLFPALASAIAAWWGGKLGVQREAEKLTRQRQFERRLDWYERAVRGLQRYAFEHKRFVNSFSNSNQNATERYRSSVTDCFGETVATLFEGLLYGRLSSLSAIVEFSKVMGSAMSSDEKFEAAGEDIENVTSATMLALAHEFREHIGFEPLPANIPRRGN